MADKSDRRVKKTTSALKQAYLQLMGQYEDEDITVLMITQHADVNRATFYTHYTNKAEFLDEILSDALEGLRASIMRPFIDDDYININKVTPTTERIFDYIERNKQTFYVLHIRLPYFKKRLETLFHTIFSQEIHIETKTSFGQLDYDIFLNYQTSATVGLIEHWISSEFKHAKTYMMEQLTILSNTQVVSLRKKE